MKWEYHFEVVQIEQFASFGWQMRANEVGIDGWELVSVSDYFDGKILCFKRE